MELTENQKLERLKRLIVNSESFQRKLKIIESNKDAAARTKIIAISKECKVLDESVLYKKTTRDWAR